VGDRLPVWVVGQLLEKGISCSRMEFVGVNVGGEVCDELMVGFAVFFFESSSGDGVEVVRVGPVVSIFIMEGREGSEEI